jgi:glyoxylase-like metal-dependent hydrolase (beta-lactamase superfamily II)
MRLRVGQRELRFIDTPGHARHHHCIWDPASRGWFAGDTFGLSYRELDVDGRAWALPTSTPVQFEPEALKASLTRLLAAEPQCMYLTHFGPVREVPAPGRAAARTDRPHGGHRARRPRPSATSASSASCWPPTPTACASMAAPCPEADLARLLAVDLELNAQGLEVWLEKNPK